MRIVGRRMMVVGKRSRTRIVGRTRTVSSRRGRTRIISSRRGRRTRIVRRGRRILLKSMSEELVP